MSRWKRAISLCLSFGVLLAGFSMVYVLTSAQALPGKDASGPGGSSSKSRLIRTAQPRKPRPSTLNPDTFTDPEIRLAYQVAKAIPQVLEYLPCYCGCFSNAGHRNNLDCFRDNHGVDCLMCRSIALEAQHQHSLGVSVRVIKQIVDDRWAPRAQ